MKASALQPTEAFLRAHGLAVKPEDFLAMVGFAIARLQQSVYPPEPRADLSQAEAETLSRGGLDLRSRGEGEPSALARTTAKYAALLETSLTTAEAAERLGVDPARVRQRLGEGSLYGIRTPKGWRLPAFQFGEDNAVPGLEEVLPRLESHLHPVAVHNFFTLPHGDLYAGEVGRALSPREWLKAGYPARAVAELVANLE